MQLVAVSTGRFISLKGHPLHATGISALTIFTVAVGVIAVVAFVLQVNDKLRGRKLRRAEEAFMEAVEANRDIESIRKEFKQLHSQIEVEIPQQARTAYLKERLHRVEIDLNSSYKEYRAITDELANERDTSDLDERLRAVIETSIVPGRRLQERQNAIIVILLIVLLLVSLSPYSVSRLAYSYFNVLGYSDEWTDSGLYGTIALGVLVLVGIILLLVNLIPGRAGTRFSAVAHSNMTPIASSIVAVGLFVTGMYFRASAIRADAGAFYVDVTGRETVAGLAFNFADLALAVALASVTLIMARNLRGRHRTKSRTPAPTSTTS